MTHALPFEAAEIYVEWREGDLGIGVSAHTDKAGEPYLNLYPVGASGWCGKGTLYYPRPRLLIDAVIGRIWDRPLIASIDAEISGRGLHVRLLLPRFFAVEDPVIRLFAPWGGFLPPCQSLPANTNWSDFPKTMEKRYENRI